MFLLRRDDFSLLKYSFFIGKRSLLKIRPAYERREENFSPPFNSHPYLLSSLFSLSLLITDRKSLFFTDKNQYHISTHLVRETRRHKKHFPHPTPRPGIYSSNPIRRFNLLTLRAILYSVVSFVLFSRATALVPSFSEERRWLPMADTKPNDPRLAKESSKRFFEILLLLSLVLRVFFLLLLLISSQKACREESSLRRALIAKRETASRGLSFFGRSGGTRSV